MAENGNVSLPNNIRQIGECKSNIKIYLEDYAYTYLKRMAGSDTEKGCMAILLGETKWEETTSYIFIRSALGVEGEEVAAEHMELKDVQWSRIHQDMEQYFPDQEIIGWSVSIPGFDMKITDEILRTHLNYFAGNQKVLFAMEPVEREEAFFVFENGNLKKQNGYYIFYEKNEQMQTYMIEKGGNLSIENEKNVSDRAVVDFRKLIAGKQEKERKEKAGKSYITGICAAAAMVVLGLTWMNHQKITEELAQETVENEIYEESVTQIPPRVTAEATATPEEEKAELTPVEEEAITPTPTEAAETTEQEEETETSSGSYQKYVVKRGDTLTKISETYYGDISAVQKICEMNQLESEDLIYTGQIILLP